MHILNRLFRKKRNRDIPPMPSWEAIVEMMRDRYLDGFVDDVVDVIYSKDHSMRYVILRDENGLFTYQLEAIYQYDEDEWKYMCFHDDALPAMWEPFRGSFFKSVFENKEDLWKEMKSEPEYKQYF